MNDRLGPGDARPPSPDWQRIARQQAQRQWPAPERPWVIAQTWQQVLFAHWPLPPDTLRDRIPAHLELDTFGGNAWLGVVPFDLSHLAPRRAPTRLRLGFPELNVRTYVTFRDRPGVWFFSLDAASLLAVLGARAAYHLPYYWAAMQIDEQAGWISYRSQRRGGADARFVGRYQPAGPIIETAPGSLERWLTDRYCLYTTSRSGRLLRADINHVPWALQPAVADIEVNTMAEVLGIDLAGAPLLHFARRTDVVNWGLERVE